MFARREGCISVLSPSFIELLHFESCSFCNTECWLFSACVKEHLFPPDDFESKFNFHPVEDLPPPEVYRHFNKVYPSKSNKGERYGKHVLPAFLLSCIFYSLLQPSCLSDKCII